MNIMMIYIECATNTCPHKTRIICKFVEQNSGIFFSRDQDSQETPLKISVIIAGVGLSVQSLQWLRPGGATMID